jgi:hypothetical protein
VYAAHAAAVYAAHADHRARHPVSRPPSRRLHRSYPPAPFLRRAAGACKHASCLQARVARILFTGARTHASRSVTVATSRLRSLAASLPRRRRRVHYAANYIILFYIPPPPCPQRSELYNSILYTAAAVSTAHGRGVSRGPQTTPRRHTGAAAGITTAEGTWLR